MLIPCPFCGNRDSHEFTYRGDAVPVRPTDGGAAPTPEWTGYVYFRDNPAGPHREFWFHSSGCRSWLVVDRNTVTHQVMAAVAAG